MEKTQKSLNDFKNSVSRTLKGIAAAFAVIGIKNFLKDSVEFYDYVTTQENKLATVMRQRMGATNDVIKSMNQYIALQEKNGVVAAEAQTAGAQELATYLDKASSLKTLIPVMNDLVAQQFGLNASGEQVATVATMVGKVMDGQLGALRRYGFTFDAAQEKILKFGNEEQRAALLAAIVHDSIGNMNEALANTPQGRALQLSFEFAGLQKEIGTTVAIFRDLMLPVLSKIIGFATAVAVRLQQVGLFFRAIFGGKGPSSTQAQTKATTIQTAAVGSLGDAFKNVGNQAKKAGDKISKAGKEAKKSLGVAGFDEVNTLADKTKSGSNANDKGASSGVGDVGAGGIDATMPDTSALENDLPQLSKKLQDLADKARGFFGTIKDFFKGLGSFIVEHKDIIIAALSGVAAGFAAFLIGSNLTGIKGAFDSLRLGVLYLVDAIKGGLASAFAFLTSPLGIIVVAITALTAAFVYFYRTNDKFKGFVDGVLNQIKDAAIYLWKNVLVPFGEFLAKVFVAAWDAIKVAMQFLWKNVIVPFGEFLAKAFVAAWDAVKEASQFLWKNVLVPLGDFIVWIWKNAVVPLAGVLKDVLGIAFSFVADVAKSFWKNVLVPLGDFFKNTFGPTVEAISAIFNVLWNNVLVPFGSFLLSSLKPAISGLTDVIVFLWNKVLEPLVSFLSGKLKQTFDTVFEGIGKTIEGLQKTFIGLMKFITGVFTGDWEKAWNGVKDIFKGVFDSLYAIVKTPLNLIIDAINTLIRGLNSISIDIPDWVPGVGGKKFGINIPNIPHLAKGGITKGPMMAVIGDNPGGQEVVSPLDKLQDMIASSVGSAVMSAMQFNNKPSNSGDVVVQIEGKTLARILKPFLEKENNRIGKTIISTS